MRAPFRPLIAFAMTAICLLTTGCALLQPELEKAAKGAGQIVNFYCDNIADESIRERLRTAVNTYAAPNSIMVSCANSNGPNLVVSPGP